MSIETEAVARPGERSDNGPVNGTFANILHRDSLAALVGKPTFGRGERYFLDGHVESVARREASIHATVRGTGIYLVRVWVGADGLAYSCECRHGTDGHFCKHAVAAVLAWLDREAREAAAPALEVRLRALDDAQRERLLLRLARDLRAREILERLLTEL